MKFLQLGAHLYLKEENYECESVSLKNTDYINSLNIKVNEVMHSEKCYKKE